MGAPVPRECQGTVPSGGFRRSDGRLFSTGAHPPFRAVMALARVAARWFRNRRRGPPVPPILALSQPPLASPAAAVLTARLAAYDGPLLPPRVSELAGADPAGLVESLYAATAAEAALPVLAVREVVENLVHADFREALVSVLDAGTTVRVSDRGPGIADHGRALQPGFSSACPAARAAVRGVGCGLPLAAALMASHGGRLELADNLGGGTVVTLALGAPPDVRAGAPGPVEDAARLPDGARLVLALLLELERADARRLAEELGRPLAACGRELVLLEHHGLVARDTEGDCHLTDRGSALVEALF